MPSQNGSYWKANYIHIVFTFVSFLLQICVWSANPSQDCHRPLWLLFICTLNNCVHIYVETCKQLDFSLSFICLGGLEIRITMQCQRSRLRFPALTFIKKLIQFCLVVAMVFLLNKNIFLVFFLFILHY